MGIFTGVGSRVLTLAAPLLTIPVTLRELGPEVFGFWMLVASISSMAMFADLGLGNGLLTRLSSSIVTNDQRTAKTLISTAYATLSSVALILLIFVAVAVPTLDLSILTGEAGTNSVDFKVIALLCLSAFAITVPLSLIQRVQYAFQEAWKSNAWQVAGATVTVVAVYAAAYSGGGTFPIIAAAVFSSPLVMLANNIYYFTWNRPGVRPSLRFTDPLAAKSLLRVGVAFFLLSLVTSFSLNVDNLVVSQLAGLETVAGFSITTKLFSLLGLAITMIALPLWPANGDALARGDIQWVRRTTKKIAILSMSAVSIGGAVLLVARNEIAAIWLGEGHTISFPLALGFVAWSVCMACVSPLFSVQNSRGIVRYQFVGWGLYALISIPLKIIAFHVAGLPGIPLAGTLVYVLFVVPSAILGYRATLRKVALGGEKGAGVNASY